MSGGRQQRAPRVDRLKFKTKFHKVLGLPCWSRVFLPDLWGSQRPAPSACWPSQYVQVRGGLDLREKGLSWPLGGWGSPFLFALGCLDGLGPEMAAYLFKALEVEVAFVTHLEVRENTHMHSSQKGGPGKTSVEKASVVRSPPNLVPSLAEGRGQVSAKWQAPSPEDEKVMPVSTRASLWCI